MDNFKTIYQILRTLERSMDLEEFDKSSFTKERFGLSEARWCRLIALLVAEGYVMGIETWKTTTHEYPRVCIVRPEITLKGLEYLHENSIMKKMATRPRELQI